MLGESEKGLRLDFIHKLLLMNVDRFSLHLKNLKNWLYCTHKVQNNTINLSSTSSVHHFGSTSRSVQASRVQRMMGPYGSMVAVVPHWDSFCLEGLSFETTP